MPEKAPKTPRLIGEEAEALYANHKSAAHDLETESHQLKNVMEVVQMDHGAALAKEAGRTEYRGKPISQSTPEELRSYRDEKMTYLPAIILRQGEAADKYDLNVAQASAHYKDNAALYHDLATHESALDGVEIKISQQESAAEPIQVHKS